MVVEKAALPTGSGGRAVMMTVSGPAVSPATAASPSAVATTIAAQAPRLADERKQICAIVSPPATDFAYFGFRRYWNRAANPPERRSREAPEAESAIRGCLRD